jgi:hypothetical protein
VQAPSDEGPADAPPQAAGDGAGCAAQAPADASEAQATPPRTVREFERALRALGFSRPRAHDIARYGFAGPAPEAPAVPEPDPADINRLRSAAERLQRLIQGSTI